MAMFSHKIKFQQFLKRLEVRIKKFQQLPIAVRLFIIFIILIFLGSAYNALSPSIEDYPRYYVSRIIDGDTIEIQDGYSKRIVRLAGIDTPETVHPRKPVECFGKEASATLTLLLTGQNVQIDFQGKGKYNRDIGYVYFKNKCVNEVMIMGGLAFHYDKYPHKYERKYEKLEKKARRNNEGLWGACNYGY